MPGLHEVLGNLANLHAAAALWLALLGARASGAPLRWAERVALPVAAFTAGESVVLLPLWCYRALAARFRGRGQADDRAAALWTLAAAVVNFAARAGIPAAAPGSEATSLLRAVFHAEAYGLWLGPLLGGAGLRRIWAAAPAVGTALAVTATIGLAVGAARSWRSDVGPLSMAVACVASLAVLMIFARPGSAAVIGERPHAAFAWARYSFQVAPLGFLAWTALLARWPRCTAPWAAVVLAVMTLNLSPPRWRIRRWDAPSWSEALQVARTQAQGACHKAPIRRGACAVRQRTTRVAQWYADGLALHAAGAVASGYARLGPVTSCSSRPRRSDRRPS
jgi:hypothetical protein